MSPPQPLDPITDLASGAAMAHELFCAYVDAGFAPSQALYLTGQVLTAGIRNEPGGPSPAGG